MIPCKAGLQLEEEPISEAGARRIVERAEGLAMVKGKWVAVDRESLRKALAAMQQAKKRHIFSPEHYCCGSGGTIVNE